VATTQGTIDVSRDAKVDKLHSKAVGLTGVLFLTVTGAAPVSAMLGNVPFAAGYGIGIYTPAAFLLATIVLTLFSVGYAAMARRVSSVGGFYSYISQGLGREAGMSAGIASLACYSVFEASLTGLFAFFGNQWLKAHLGIDVGWLWLALGMLAFIAILSYRDVKLSAQVLGLALILEVVILGIFVAGVLLAKGPGAFNPEALNVLNVWTPVTEQKVGEVAIPLGAAAVGVFMAFWSWVGFEMAPNYAEESRDPKRIIPLSLFLGVIGLGLFYIIVSWSAVSAYNNEAEMVAKAFADSSNFYMTPLEQFVGTWAKELLAVLILTSSFACGMAFHNTAARYMYSLGREGVMPRVLGATHPKYKSPHVASLVQSVLAAIWVIAYALTNGMDDANAQAFLGVYTLFAVLGTGLLLVLQAIVSLAIIFWFRNNGGGNVFTTVIAPAISVVVQLWLVYLLVANLGTFAGTSAFANAIPYVAAGILGIGLLWGLMLRMTGSEGYRNIGHMVNEEA
jgi:amino acid transporter